MSHLIELRDLPVFRPYDADSPWPQDDERSFVRIARIDDKIIAGYRICRLEDATTFEIQKLFVAAEIRRQGLGRWLVGHALGLSESRGGRTLQAAAEFAEHSAGVELLRHAGFRPGDNGTLRFVLTPE